MCLLKYADGSVKMFHFIPHTQPSNLINFLTIMNYFQEKKQWEGPVALLTYTTDSKICTATGNNGNAAPTLRFAC